MEYVLGVDGGGTKTLVLLGDQDGNVLARGLSGPSNYNAVGFDAACLALESAIGRFHTKSFAKCAAVPSMTFGLRAISASIACSFETGP